MVDLVLESARAVVVGVILVVLLGQRGNRELRGIKGWWQIALGFCLVGFGTLIDVTDNFPHLGRFVVLGETPAQAFLEKVVGYLFGYLLLAVGFLLWLPGMVAHQAAIQRDLDKAKQDIKVLGGLLPICAACKKVREDSGYWTQIESYIRDHSEATFSHGMCPDCLKAYYPDLMGSDETLGTQASGIPPG